MTLNAEQVFTPQVYNLSNEIERNDYQKLHQSGAIEEYIDALPEAVEDLFRIDFPFVAPGSPEYVKTLAMYREQNYSVESAGSVVYYPWRKVAVRIPSERDFFKLRTARNKFLIEPEEQDRFYNSYIGIAGLSVGSSILNSIVLSGGGRNLRIADNDTLSITNLNRLHASVCDLARNKAVLSARRIYEMNPYQKLEVYTEGLQLSNIDEFFGVGGRQLNVYIEEMDDIKRKIDSRFKARELRIPVVMASDNGDNTVVDVERFDIEPNRPLFHGLVEEDILRNCPEKPSMAEKVRLADKIVGSDVMPRMQISLTQVGTKLPAWPQLGNAATLSGVAVSYIVRRILAGDDMPSGRYEVNLDSLIDPAYHTDEQVNYRKKQKDNFVLGFQLLYGEKRYE